MRRSVLASGAALGGLLLVGLPVPAANADYYDFYAGRYVCTSYQCQIGTALSSGDVSAAAAAVQRYQQASLNAQSSAQRRVANSYVRAVQRASSGSGSSSGYTAPDGSTWISKEYYDNYSRDYDAESDAYAQQMNEYYAKLAAWQSQQGLSAPAPAPPPSPYDHECIASTPDISVSYTSQMPTFDVLAECMGELQYRWGYTVDGNFDPIPDKADYDVYSVMTGTRFTPPMPEDTKYNGVWFSVINWVGTTGPFHFGDSTSFAGWYPKNDPWNWDEAHPDPIPILPKPPGELNAERAAALAEETAAVTVTPSARVKKGRMTVKGEPNTDYVVVARKGKKIHGTWSVTTNSRGVGKIKGVSIPKKSRLLVSKAPE